MSRLVSAALTLTTKEGGAFGRLIWFGLTTLHTTIIYLYNFTRFYKRERRLPAKSLHQTARYGTKHNVVGKLLHCGNIREHLEHCNFFNDLGATRHKITGFNVSAALTR